MSVIDFVVKHVKESTWVERRRHSGCRRRCCQGYKTSKTIQNYNHDNIS